MLSSPSKPRHTLLLKDWWTWWRSLCRKQDCAGDRTLRLFTLRFLPLAAPCLMLVFNVGTAPSYGQSQDRVVAVVNGQQITQRQVDDSVISQIFPLEQQIYALRKSALENLILRRILEDEAKRQLLPPDVLRNQLTSGSAEVHLDEVESLYSENARAFAAMSPDEAKERIRLDLESQARMRNYREALSRLKEAASVEVFLDEPRLLTVNDQSAPSLGAGTALVTIIEFSDFQCPHCKSVQVTLKRILQEYGNNVRLIFKHLPLVDIHPQGLLAARAAFCARGQNNFWQYHDALFSSDSLSSEALKLIAKQLALNLPKLEACLESDASRAAVIKDIQEAKRLGINSTPAFIINGKLIQGAIGLEEFRGIVEGELRLAQRESKAL